LLETRQQREDAGQDGVFGSGRRGGVDFLVEDLVEQDFEGVREVF
jgi:hypothetical protein